MGMVGDILGDLDQILIAAAGAGAAERLAGVHVESAV
jgi:hypothetical protein